jgi:dipeptidyl aminopeptidase/acylaminoacyl peptidase
MDYTDLDAYLALPRVSGLALSSDGTRLVTTVATLDSTATRYVSALWEVDPTGQAAARRLTRSAKGEGSAAFAADGEVLFTSVRPDPAGEEPSDETPSALWLLPRTGEARVVATRPGGIGAVAVARDATTLVALSDTLPASTDTASDEERRTARKDKKVDAVLHAGYPIRYWDRDLGAGQTRLLAADLPAGEDCVQWRDLTPTPGRALHGGSVDLAPDGRTAVSTWAVAESRGGRRVTLVAVDTASGERRVLLDDGVNDHLDPRISHDGHWVACVVERRTAPDQPADQRLLVLPLDGSQPPREVAPGWDRWTNGHRWSPDGAGLLVTADEAGGAPVFRIDLASGAVTRLTGDRAHYTDLAVSPDGEYVYALRDAIDAAPAPVRLDSRAADQAPVLLQGPGTAPAPPGSVDEVTTAAPDGTPLRSWLVLPEGDGPHPMLLWVHGGPLGSWNGWSWRWNPWLMAARGYAVLLPDPALSTGYGRSFVQRGWGDWGGAPFHDLMALTDAALEHPAVDATRIAAMGGSFGGYMANWIAGHTDRFAAIVTHASLWDLEQFSTTTDASYYWTREMTPEMTRVHSPSRYADGIRTPMLVVHGDKDYRVPIGEGLRLWWDLCSRADNPEEMPHRLLYYPNENHWVLTPQHSKLWYETVHAFLAVHVLGEPWQTPDLLT